MWLWLLICKHCTSTIHQGGADALLSEPTQPKPSKRQTMNEAFMIDPNYYRMDYERILELDRRFKRRILHSSGSLDMKCIYLGRKRNSAVPRLAKKR